MDVQAAWRRLARSSFFLVLLLVALPALAQTDDQKRDQETDRLFGVLPNNTTVARDERFEPITTKEAFKIATLDSFDPYVIPLVAGMAALAQMENQPPSMGRGLSGYGKRYLTAFSDSTISTMMTVAVVPTLLRQDPRYFERGEGTFWYRVGYAASRSVITRSRSGHRQFNFSELGGDAIAVGLSNAYYPQESRSWADSLTRLGMLVMWHTLANEIKEFWPDIRRKINENNE